MNKDTQRKYDFMKFELNKLEKLYKNTVRDISNIDAESEFRSFCSQCYHFKDWLIAEFPKQKKDIEKYISNNEWLSICADFTNKDKHQNLDKYPRHQEDVGHGNNHIAINFTEKGFEVNSRYEVKVGNQKIDSLKVAQESFNAWNKYLAGNNINN